MTIVNKGFEGFKDIINSKQKPQKPPAYPWQELALRIINELNIPNFKRNSVFQVCKKYPKGYIEKCMNDTKELCTKGECWKYFFKIVNSKY